MSLFLRSLRGQKPLQLSPSTMSRPVYSRQSPFGKRFYQSGVDRYFNNIRTGKAILWTTIGANVAVFCGWQYAQNLSRGSMADILSGAMSPNSSRLKPIHFLNQNFLCSWDHIHKGRYWTLLTSAYSHQNLGHLAGNMFSLYAFGSVLLSVGLSPVVFATIFFGSAIAGNIGFLYHQARGKRARQSYGLGASGAVMGTGAAAALMLPTAPMLLFGFIPVPLFVLLGGYVYYDSYYLDDPNSVVGHSAHLGGAAFGAASYILFLRRFGGVLGRFR